MKILHLITDLDYGGAENFLINLIKQKKIRKHKTRVIVMTSGGLSVQSTVKEGIDVQTLGLKRGEFNPLIAVKLIRMIKKFDPDILQTWLYHADLLGCICKPFTNVKNLIWNFRCSNMDLSKYSFQSRVVFHLLKFLCKKPSLIVINSNSGREFHEHAGFIPNSWRTIPNGVDTEKFKSFNNARKNLFTKLNIPENYTLIGNVGRFDPMKDYVNLFRAFSLIKKRIKKVKFLLIGRDLNRKNENLMKMIDVPLAKHNLFQEISFLPPTENIHKIIPGLDLLCTSSAFGEGCPNILLEAMSSCVPCVVTDVGDSKEILGDCGIVVRPKDYRALANGMERLLKMNKEALNKMLQKGRRRIIKDFSIEYAEDQYLRMYQECMK